jgi:bifunctional non-homologous end joining protein LigD
MAEPKLKRYRSKRSFDKSPEPEGKKKGGAAAANRFVIQEHHARRLHWDLRLEHDGVLASWALPKGVPDDPDQNRLAVQTEDHPLDYYDFEGEIPKGEYGAGKVEIWDRGTYEAEKFEPDKVVATFHGERVQGRYALFRTRGKDWLIHRMDPPAEPDRQPFPERIEPMKARLASLPTPDEGWGYEIKWDGVRAIAYCQAGRVRLESRNLRDITAQYPEVQRLGRQLGSRDVVLDGELVAFDENDRPSFQRLQGRMHLASETAVRRRMKEIAATYVIFDLLFCEGCSLIGLPYEERRRALEALDLTGASWQTPAYHRGHGRELLAASKRRGLEGIVAKRLDSRYLPGKRSGAWLKVKNVRSQEVVIGGWLPGKGRRAETIGALLAGYYDYTDGDGRLRYAGKIGTGFDAANLRLLSEKLEPLRRDSSPFQGRQPQKESIFVEPQLVADVAFSEWTSAGTLRQASYKGLRTDKRPEEVVREEAEHRPDP